MWSFREHDPITQLWINASIWYVRELNILVAFISCIKSFWKSRRGVAAAVHRDYRESVVGRSSIKLRRRYTAAQHARGYYFIFIKIKRLAVRTVYLTIYSYIICMRICGINVYGAQTIVVVLSKVPFYIRFTRYIQLPTYAHTHAHTHTHAHMHTHSRTHMYNIRYIVLAVVYYRCTSFGHTSSWCVYTQ